MRESACRHRVREFALDMLYVVFCVLNARVIDARIALAVWQYWLRFVFVRRMRGPCATKACLLCVPMCLGH